MKLSKVMKETLQWMLDSGGNSANFGCPGTDATFEALRYCRLVWKNCKHYELNKAGSDAAKPSIIQNVT